MLTFVTIMVGILKIACAVALVATMAAIVGIAVRENERNNHE